MQSPSARKVWIEILYVSDVSDKIKSHLPRGRCGLKLFFIHDVLK